MSKESFPKLGFMATFSVSCVWFASHAGGGFATGIRLPNTMFSMVGLRL